MEKEVAHGSGAEIYWCIVAVKSWELLFAFRKKPIGRLSSIEMQVALRIPLSLAYINTGDNECCK